MAISVEKNTMAEACIERNRISDDPRLDGWNPWRNRLVDFAKKIQKDLEKEGYTFPSLGSKGWMMCVNRFRDANRVTAVQMKEALLETKKPSYTEPVDQSIALVG
jgi:hypothetical protein